MLTTILRKFFTNPFSILFLGLGFLLLAFIGSVLPTDFFLGQVIRTVGIIGFLIGVHLIVVLVLWTARSVYSRHVKGVPEGLDNTQKAILATGAHITSAILILASVVLASP